MTIPPDWRPPESPYLRHADFHPWAAKIGSLEQQGASLAEQVRRMTASVDALAERVTSGQDRLRAEMLASHAEADRREQSRVANLEAHLAASEQKLHKLICNNLEAINAKERADARRWQVTIAVMGLIFLLSLWARLDDTSRSEVARATAGAAIDAAAAGM